MNIYAYMYKSVILSVRLYPSKRRPQRGIGAAAPAGGESGGDADGPPPPLPERLLGFGDLLKRAERAQAEVIERGIQFVTNSCCTCGLILGLGFSKFCFF